MSELIEKIDSLLNKYYDAMEKADKRKQEKIYTDFLQVKKEIKANFDSLSKSERKTYRMISSEFRVLSNEEARAKLFSGADNKESEPKKLKTNDEYLSSAKNTASNTTKILKNSLQELEQANEIGAHALSIIQADGEKLKNVNNGLDSIQSDGKIAMKLITRSLKRLYTDKLILLFIFIIVCLIAVIVFYKYDIIQM
jgi:hypothetical protein